jgi:hypothetical protein
MDRDFKYGKNGLFPFRESRNGELFALAKREEKHCFSEGGAGKKETAQGRADKRIFRGREGGGIFLRTAFLRPSRYPPEADL